MASPIEILDTNIKDEGKSLDNKFKKYYLIGGTLFLIALSCVAITFAWKVPIFNFDFPADAERWGQYGDFFGGVIGTIITFLSIIFLYRAYKEQHLANVASTEVNHDIIKNNERSNTVEEQQLYSELLRQFDDNFKTLMALYQASLLSYKAPPAESGKASLSAMVSHFIASTIYVSKDVYTKRTQSASTLFNDFITKYRTTVNTHMRLLYQIFGLLDSEYIAEDDKIIYAKMLRGQLTDEELILIRYNCMTRRGAKMKRPVFHYNILKHLPYLDLFEFRQYRKGLSSKQINTLHDELIYFRKEICSLFLSESSQDKVLKQQDYSKSYSLRIRVNNTNTDYTFELEKSPSKPGRNYNAINPILDKFSVTDLEMLLFDFHIELFRHSSFRVLNRDAKYNHINKTSGANTIISVTAKNTFPIIVSYFQIENPKEVYPLSAR